MPHRSATPGVLSRRSVLLASLAVVLSATAPARADVGSVRAAVVYGTDGRADVYEEADPALRAVAAASTLAVVPLPHVVPASAGTYQLDGPPLGTTFGLCAEQRFVEQPVAAVCSATLIDDDLVLTAGHCIHPILATNPQDRALRCDTLAFVFDDSYVAAGQLSPIGNDDVYHCRRVVLKRHDSVDYAIVQLDRAVTGHAPAAISSLQLPLSIGTPLAVIGHGSGLPTKIGTGGSLTHTAHVGDDYLVASTDTFGGDSGAGVFDASSQLLGVLIEGLEDYVTDPSRGCDVVNVLPESEGSESILFVGRPLADLCQDLAYPSARLCGRAPSCGDGQCTAGEPSACAADCSGEICGNGYCVASAGETASSCEFDCNPSGATSPGAKSRGCAIAVGAEPGPRSGPGIPFALAAFAVLRFLARRRRK
ncbi:MAG: serine protease [Polyangiales bacterium]